MQTNWNDWWEYTNLYTAWYRTLDGQRLKLGNVKIDDPERSPENPPTYPLPLGDVGDTLPNGCVSVGQSDEYYRQLAALPEHERAALCTALRDAVWDPRRLTAHRATPVVRKSLLRAVSYQSVLGEYHRIIRNEGEANYYRLAYGQPGFDVEFVVDPASKPRTNLHVVIGRNGVGKTTLLRNITRLLATGSADDEGEYVRVFDEDGQSEGVLAGVQYVSWSAFDNFAADREWNFDNGIAYSRIGVKGIWQATPGGGLERPGVVAMPHSSASAVSDDELPVDSFVRSFVRSFSLVVERQRGKMWSEALESLESDPVFRHLQILSELRAMLAEAIEGDLSSITYARVSDAFNELSDGHKVVLLTITYVAATLAEQTLVVLDEPEAHLHPPLLASLIRCLNELLIKKNAMAIVATHSPVVLQEVPVTCAWVVRRSRAT
jgi:predicted ATPase